MTGPAHPWWWQGGGGHVPQCCFLLFLPHCPRTPTRAVGQCHLGLGWHRAAGMAQAGCSDGVSTEVWGLPPVPRAGLPRGFGVRPCPRPGGSVSRGPQLEPQPLGPPWRLERAGEHSLGGGSSVQGQALRRAWGPGRAGAPLSLPSWAAAAPGAGHRLRPVSASWRPTHRAAPSQGLPRPSLRGRPASPAGTGGPSGAPVGASPPGSLLHPAPWGRHPAPRGRHPAPRGQHPAQCEGGRRDGSPFQASGPCPARKDGPEVRCGPGLGVELWGDRNPVCCCLFVLRPQCCKDPRTSGKREAF